MSNPHGMIAITSGSAAASCSMVRPPEMLPGLPEEVRAARPVDELGHPVARPHQRIDPLDARDGRTGSPGRRQGLNRVEPFHEAGHELVAAFRGAQRRRHRPDVLPDVGQRHRLKGHDAGASSVVGSMP